MVNEMNETNESINNFAFQKSKKPIMEEINSDVFSDSEDYTSNVGTIRYMAPEIKTNYYDNKVDIYSAVILIY